MRRTACLLLQLDGSMRRDPDRDWPAVLTLWAEQGISAEITMSAVPSGVAVDQVVAMRNLLSKVAGWTDLMGGSRVYAFFDLDGAGIAFCPELFELPPDLVETEVRSKLLTAAPHQSELAAVRSGLFSAVRIHAARLSETSRSR